MRRRACVGRRSSPAHECRAASVDLSAHCLNPSPRDLSSVTSFLFSTAVQANQFLMVPTPGWFLEGGQNVPNTSLFHSDDTLTGRYWDGAARRSFLNYIDPAWLAVFTPQPHFIMQMRSMMCSTQRQLHVGLQGEVTAYSTSDWSFSFCL